MSWLRALFSETILSVWWILSAASTLSTFYFTSWSGKPRLLLAMSTVIGFGWANFRVFQRQEDRIRELSKAIELLKARTSKLQITPDEGSRYILHPVGSVPHSDFAGGLFEFHLMIENTGLKNSTVDNFQVEIIELQETFKDLKPLEGRTGVQGRHCQHGLQPGRILSQTGMVRLDGEHTTNHGTLLFSIPGLNLERFVRAGLRMHGEQRRFDPLRCRLTIVDRTGSSAKANFELRED